LIRGYSDLSQFPEGWHDNLERFYQYVKKRGLLSSMGKSKCYGPDSKPTGKTLAEHHLPEVVMRLFTWEIWKANKSGELAKWAALAEAKKHSRETQ
jgi:hypothetical protein